MAALALSDLQAALDDERHLGFGYAESRYLSKSQRNELDRTVVAIANEAGFDAEELFLWTNSKYGRWLCDFVHGATVTRQRVQGCLSRAIVADLKEQA